MHDYYGSFLKKHKIKGINTNPYNSTRTIQFKHTLSGFLWHLKKRISIVIGLK